MREKEIRDRESIQKEIDKALGTNLTQHKRSKKKSNPKDTRKARYARLTKIEAGSTNQKDSKRKYLVNGRWKKLTKPVKHLPKRNMLKNSVVTSIIIYDTIQEEVHKNC